MNLKPKGGNMTRGKIRKIHEEHASFMDGVDYSFSEFYPIALTESDVNDVLGIGSMARFGFMNWYIGKTEDAEFFLLYHDDNFFVGNILRTNINFEEHIYFNVIKRVQLIHELQNFLRFIGSEKVAEQFK